MNRPQENDKSSALLLSLVVPVFYEEECISEFITQVTKHLLAHKIEYEIIFVDDGSADKTVELIQQSIDKNDRIRLVQLSRNFGKPAAVTAGITFATGDYILYMDPDLQDPPSEIATFFTKVKEGYDLVFGVREVKMDGYINCALSKLFWNSLNLFTGLRIPQNLAVMRIFSRQFADEFLRYGESNRFIEGIFMDIGMKATQITIPQQPRFAGTSKFTFRRKVQLATTAIVAFSDLPLKIAVRLGFLLISLSFLSGLGIILSKFLFVDFQAGWPSLITTLIAGFGLQSLLLGILGIYIGNIYRETKSRPLYTTQQLHNFPTRP